MMFCLPGTKLEYGLPLRCTYQSSILPYFSDMIKLMHFNEIRRMLSNYYLEGINNCAETSIEIGHLICL